GEATFSSYISNDGVYDRNKEGIFVMDQNYQPTLVARVGDDAVGIDGDVHFSAVGDYPTLVNGLSVFSVELAGEGVTTSNYGSIWAKKTSGDLHLVERDGDPAPGVPGYHFYDVDNYRVNQAGQMILYGFATTAGAQASHGGYWSVTDAG